MQDHFHHHGPKTRTKIYIVALPALACAAVYAYPVSTHITRVLSLLLPLILLGALFHVLKGSARMVLAVLCALPCLAFVILSLAAHPATPGDIRAGYLDHLQAYEGTRYVWGGENMNGMDCSGLLRKPMAQSLLVNGFLHGQAALLREAFGVWYHDTTAKGMKDDSPHLATRLFEAASVNAADHTKLEPGDFMVTENGAHTMIYLGEKKWIEADPHAEAVITATAPAKDNVWFEKPAVFMRWNVLAETVPAPAPQ